MEQLSIYCFVHSIANGVAVLTPQNGDAFKSHLPVSAVDITMSQTEPRKATVTLPKWMAIGYGLYRESVVEQGDVPETTTRIRPTIGALSGLSKESV